MEGIQACVYGLLAWATVSLGKAAIVGVDSAEKSDAPPFSRRKRRIQAARTALVFAGALAAAPLTRLDAVLLILAGLLIELVIHTVSSLVERRGA